MNAQYPPAREGKKAESSPAARRFFSWCLRFINHSHALAHIGANALFKALSHSLLPAAVFCNKRNPWLWKMCLNDARQSVLFPIAVFLARMSSSSSSLANSSTQQQQQQQQQSERMFADDQLGMRALLRYVSNTPSSLISSRPNVDKHNTCSLCSHESVSIQRECTTILSNILHAWGVVISVFLCSFLSLAVACLFTVSVSLC